MLFVIIADSLVSPDDSQNNLSKYTHRSPELKPIRFNKQHFSVFLNERLCLLAILKICSLLLSNAVRSKNRPQITSYVLIVLGYISIMAFI